MAGADIASSSSAEATLPIARPLDENALRITTGLPSAVFCTKNTLLTLTYSRVITMNDLSRSKLRQAASRRISDFQAQHRGSHQARKDGTQAVSLVTGHFGELWEALMLNLVTWYLPRQRRPQVACWITKFVAKLN
jgi:hypothetical protein